MAEPEVQRADLLAELHGHLARRLLSVAATTAHADDASPRPDKRRTSATLAQATGFLALLSALLVVPAIPLGITALVLGVRLRIYFRATGQPTGPANSAIVMGAGALIIAIWLLVVLMSNETFY